MFSVKTIFCGALLISIAMAACQKKSDAPTPGVAGSTAAAPAAGSNTPGSTNGVTGSGTLNAPRTDPVPGQTANATGHGASAASSAQ